MNKLTKKDIVFKDGVFDIRDDFIINFDEYNISYKEFIVKYIKRWYNDFDSFFESNIYCFEIPLLNIKYKIMCPEIYSFTQWHLPYSYSKVLGWNYFGNYLRLGLFDSRIKDIYIRNSFLYLKGEEVDYKFKKNCIISHIKNECEHNYNRYKLFAKIENPFTLSFENFDKEEFWEANNEHPLNSNNIIKKFTKKEKQYSYLLKDKNTGYYKIGKSINPLKREKTLQSEKPTISLIKKFKNDYESELQNKYKGQKIRGEWYNLSKTQVQYICTHYK